MMDIVFMGTAPFAIPSLLHVAQQKDMNLVLVITQPDRTRGRGHKIQFTEFKKAALSLDVPLYQPENIKSEEAIERIRESKPDFLVVVAYGQILSEEILQLPGKSAINVHGSLLPKYRGAAPVHWAVMKGEQNTGVCTMHMVKALDAGDIIYSASTEILPEETTQDIYERLQNKGAELLVKTLRDVYVGDAPRVPQCDEEATYAPAITKTDRYIDWFRKGIDIENQVRGLYPKPLAIARYQNEDYLFTKVEYQENRPEDVLERDVLLPGTVGLASPKSGLWIRCYDGWIHILSLKAPNKKEMSARDFLSGFKIPVGTIFESEITK